MKPYTKPPLSVPEQLALLRERGIEITDPDAAHIALQQVSYYRLSGYCLPFKDGDKQYAPGTQLSTILGLYEMDRRLRLVLLDGIERVEVAVRCAVSNAFALRYGTFGHLQAANFRPHFDPRRRVALAHVRNICAHHSRLWDRTLSIQPRAPKNDPHWLPPLVPRRDRVWIMLLILRQMLALHHAGQDWQAEIEELLAPLSEMPMLRNRMGMPADWLDHPLWNVA